MLAVFVLGALAATGQAPLGWWFVALPALAGVIVRVAAAGGRKAMRLAWVAGAGHFIAALNWIVQPFLVDAAQDGWMAPFALPMMGFGLALFWALAALPLAWFGNRIWGFALALAAGEFLRGHVLTGFPWAQLGHVWIDTPVAQAAALIGPYGLSLLTLGLAAALAASWVARRALPAALALAFLAAVWGWGAMRLAAPDPLAPGLTLRLVQPNAAQQAKWDPEHASRFFDTLMRLSAQAPAPDLVIWPETSLPYLMDAPSELAGTIAAAAAGATVILGRQRVEGARFWNSATVLAPDGTILADYDKHHLVPFGEYIPFGDALFDRLGISAFAAARGNGYSAGPGPRVLDLGPKLGKVLPLICYEAVFPQDLRGVPRPDWLLQITNDAWFGRWSGPFQHAAQARLRAIEQGLPLVRVANTGVTAVYDAHGRTVAALPFATASALDAALPGALPATPYARWGEAPFLLLLAGFALIFLRRRRTPAP